MPVSADVTVRDADAAHHVRRRPLVDVPVVAQGQHDLVIRLQPGQCPVELVAVFGAGQGVLAGQVGVVSTNV